MNKLWVIGSRRVLVIWSFDQFLIITSCRMNMSHLNDSIIRLMKYLVWSCDYINVWSSHNKGESLWMSCISSRSNHWTKVDKIWYANNRHPVLVHWLLFITFLTSIIYIVGNVMPVWSRIKNTISATAFHLMGVAAKRRKKIGCL